MQMFQILQEAAAPEAVGPAPLAESSVMNGVPKPPPTYLPPIGASQGTWPNIYKNLKRIDYCTEQFDYLSNRIKCIHAFTKGPFLY
mmetsp:Transcript_42706/g.85905  ORF Transcript_42706/g.85905 Transcript_42706/m.85905 type:complete len:86 (+) Transcript_42706:116-373(+)|eukprot:CAMPEP_0196722038 /NCGR_PEP_ID=MMETSP1091-20130531/4475_1 /TAXON_ID=302021 /ORGANISM="Rhodomonas sp., Strain CCMP768" /LENGTH=85 /DNA_ID=CAMNT_0042063639 /DNA_START=121 /DNA_END=378 /DNA_ORIENTATION=+